MFRPVGQVAAPGTKFAVSVCNLLLENYHDGLLLDWYIESMTDVIAVRLLYDTRCFNNFEPP